jgi:hypothetical protein
MTVRSDGLRPRLGLALVVLALLAGGLETAGVPHVHTAPGVGLWNLDHDLAYLAALGHAAPVAASPVSICLIVVDAAATAAAAPPSAPALGGADPRAPPVPRA